MHLFAFSSISAENSDIFHTLSSGAKILEIVSPKLLTVKRWELFLRQCTLPSACSLCLVKRLVKVSFWLHSVVVYMFWMQLQFSQPDLPGYVGFANLPNQVHRKSVKKGFEFTLMVVGGLLNYFLSV